ncbi:hypothetical protein niasHS_005318 [Heterodera schachtii]|uniref:Uncharacterized protein n=1 Tax=Heterodera schachtii TaxID=97005 RepID=A0ABD2J912_HETSC
MQRRDSENETVAEEEEASGTTRCCSTAAEDPPGNATAREGEGAAESGQWSGEGAEQPSKSAAVDVIPMGSQSHSSAVASSNSGAASSDSGGEKAESEDDELSGGGAAGDEEEGDASPCECVQCEVCMAENWWRMAAYQNTFLQQHQSQTDGDTSGATSVTDSNGFDVPSNASSAGLDLIGSAATLILSQQQQMVRQGDTAESSADDLLRADFSMPKLREFFECQKAMGVPNFPEDFDEFWLLVVKARLFNVFKYRGPEAYNRIVLKIRDIAHQFRAQVEEREHSDGTEKPKRGKKQMTN